MTCETKSFASAADKQKAYATALAQAESLVAGVTNRIGALANLCALLKDTFPHYFWVGFYLVEGDNLCLGLPRPCGVLHHRQGPRRVRHGVGAGANPRRPDVEQFPGHIACSSRSRSEIVQACVQGRQCGSSDRRRQREPCGLRQHRPASP